MKNVKGIWIGTLIGVVLGIGLITAKHYLRDYWQEFSMKNITMELPRNPELDIAPLTPPENAKLLEILSQPYTYLGMGNQVFAFESADHQYVLKFFKFGHLKPNGSAEQERSKERRIQRIFSSHKLAYELNKDNAGLIYMQLNPNSGFHHEVEVKDRWGYHRKIDLSKVIFVVQEKTTPARKEISSLLDKGDVATAKKRFQALIDLHLSEYSRGIYDQDHNVMHNTGFIGDKAIRFDIGKMAKKEDMKEHYHEDLERVRKRIDKWLQKYYPKYHDEIMNGLNIPVSTNPTKK